ncbi:MAG: helix-turn-helix transcriptional regulator [Erysipelotrichaceae bacterium]|nr:helix-turn-helix transcriptional regulator [Erysipelotrichaceae bacterium]
MYFSDKLSLFMKQRNVRIVDLAKLVDIKRPNVYKIVKGTRTLADKSYVKQFADALQLTNEETNELYTAYEIDKVGSYVYFRRKKVEDILKLSVYWDVNDNFFIEKGDSALDIQEYQYYQGKHAINSILSQLLTIEAKKDDSNIKMYCQPNKYLMNLIQYLGNINPKIQVTHIFGLDNSMSTTDNDYYNLDYLLNICPIIVSSLNYIPYYYRTSIPFTNHNTFFSNVIMTSEYVLLLTNDYQNAMLYNDKEIIDIYENLFSQYLKESQPLIQPMDFISYSSDLYNKQQLIYTTPCPTYVFTLDEIELVARNIHNDFYQKDQFVQYYYSIIQMQQQYLKNNQGNTYYYFTVQGLEYFCKTGYFHDLPQSLVDPLTVEETLEITRRWRDFVEEYPFVVMLDMPAFPANSTLTITFDNGQLLFTCINAKGIPISVKLNESSMYVAFDDYFHDIIDNHSFSKEESVKIIEEHIKKLEEKIV